LEQRRKGDVLDYAAQLNAPPVHPALVPWRGVSRQGQLGPLSLGRNRTPKQAHISLIRKPKKPKRSPLLNLKLTLSKYQSGKTFLENAYWSVELK
jgi:hypothetical protein